jgi:hypothetical protein
LSLNLGINSGDQDGEDGDHEYKTQGSVFIKKELRKGIFKEMAENHI